MYVGVIHTIKDSSGWVEGLRDLDLSALPPDVQVVASATASDASRAVCLWQAPSVEAVEQILEQIVGEIAVNDCFEAPEPMVIAATQGQQMEPVGV